MIKGKKITLALLLSRFKLAKSRKKNLQWLINRKLRVHKSGFFGTSEIEWMVDIGLGMFHIHKR